MAQAWGSCLLPWPEGQCTLQLSSGSYAFEGLLQEEGEKEFGTDKYTDFHSCFSLEFGRQDLWEGLPYPLDHAAHPCNHYRVLS